MEVTHIGHVRVNVEGELDATRDSSADVLGLGDVARPEIPVVGGHWNHADPPPDVHHPRTRYVATRDGVRLAAQRFGSGPDLVVLDAFGIERAAVHGSYEAGPVALLLAARHPDRIDEVFLENTSAKDLASDDVPHGIPTDVLVTDHVVDGGVPDSVALHPAGAHDLKGVPGPRTLIRVARATPPAPAP
ncbi:MAG: hypothetical protein WDA60_19495 [Acidimicrobiia bacterium]